VGPFRGLQGCVCFQWVLDHRVLLGNDRADEEVKKAADLDDGGQRGMIFFEVVKNSIRKQVKDGLLKDTHTSQVYCDGFTHLQGTSRREQTLFTQLWGDRSLLLGEIQDFVQVPRLFWS
jgi:hypothetical protein